MIVKTLTELIDTPRDVEWGNGNSRRFLIAQDGTQSSLTDTVVRAGSHACLEYKHHLEACYCTSGSGEIHDPATGKSPSCVRGRCTHSISTTSIIWSQRMSCGSSVCSCRARRGTSPTVSAPTAVHRIDERRMTTHSGRSDGAGLACRVGSAPLPQSRAPPLLSLSRRGLCPKSPFCDRFIVGLML
jgi:hypothetical protein